MRRKLVWVAALVLLGGMTYAGDYHTGSQLVCSQCHTMHASQQHSFGGNTVGYPQTWTPSPYLTKGPINEMCLSCHNDASFAPDVYGTDTGLTLTNRSAGALNDSTAPDGYQTYMGHTLGSLDDAPGDGNDDYTPGAEGLECTNCHQPHGYAGYNQLDGNGAVVANSYRNVAGLVGFSISYAATANNLALDVFETGPAEYETADVNLNEPNQTGSGFANWCGSCHGNFHGAVGGPEIGGSGAPPEHFIRHPSASTDIGAVGGGHSSLADFSGNLYRLRVMSATGDWGTQGVAWAAAPTDLTQTCVSCHKAHGNQTTFGLIYADGANEIFENGSAGGTYITMCGQCHVQAP